MESATPSSLSEQHADNQELLDRQMPLAQLLNRPKRREITRVGREKL